jgi:hypothetical protein
MILLPMLYRTVSGRLRRVKKKRSTLIAPRTATSPMSGPASGELPDMAVVNLIPHHAANRKNSKQSMRLTIAPDSRIAGMSSDLSI